MCLCVCDCVRLCVCLCVWLGENISQDQGGKLFPPPSPPSPPSSSTIHKKWINDFCEPHLLAQVRYRWRGGEGEEEGGGRREGGEDDTIYD